MYLKRVELHGFKSFADKSVIEFTPGVTGIVGPNGCGKSNITDAIRWVLGEKSAKALRGDNMSDVIFSGSEDRKAQNLAEVTLVFDNEDHYLDYDANEVEITRRLYRINNEAEYYINRQPCRLKDITTLIMDTGLGKDTLSIISQNNINDFVAQKPEERRPLFEEAAGVAKYKARKRESVAKLERTTNNLERVDDIVVELEKQVGPLKRQKEKAETYLAYQKQLEEVEVSVLVKVIENLSTQLKTLDDQIKTSDQEKTVNDGNILIKENQSEELSKKMFHLDQDVNNLQNELFTVMKNVSDLEAQKATIDASRKQAASSNNQEDLKAKIASLKGILKDALREYNDRVERYQEVKAEKEQLSAQQSQNAQAQEVLRHEIENLNFEIHKKRSEKTQLVDQIENKSNYGYGVRSILKAKDSLSGILGTVSDLLTAQKGYEMALATALGGSVQNIVTASEDDAKRAIAFLRKNHAGRATFMPLEKMQPRKVREDHALICEQAAGCLGLMSRFVSYDEKITPIVENLLGNIILADNLDHASQLSSLLYARYRIVTLEGDVVNVGGSLTGGSMSKKNNAFAQKEALERLEKAIKKDEKAYNEKRITLNRAENEGRELSSLFMQKQMSFAKLEVVVTNKKNELTMAKSDYEAAAKDHEDLVDDVVEDHSLLDELNAQKKRRDELSEEIQAKRTLRMSYVNEKEALENELKTMRSDNRRYEKALTENKIAKTKHETEIQNYLMRLNDTYMMTFEHAKTLADPDIDLDASTRQVKELRNRIASLGSVNTEAIAQYEEVSARYEELTKNRQELKAAQDKLLTAIEDMDHIMVDRFTKTFEAINKEFNNVFRTLFGGGHAALHYTNPDDILETGIDIEAQPPGKAAKLHSFSGGENALIALSCLFAIISVRPVPLCILDEVEAALDMANVERFAKYLQTFADRTQFIVVTHREGTMAHCDLLYGATMQQKGVTKLVSVQLKEAQQMAS